MTTYLPPDYAGADSVYAPIVEPFSGGSMGTPITVSNSAGLTAALAAVVPGGKIILQNGFYTGTFVVPATATGSFSIPTVIQAQNEWGAVCGGAVSAASFQLDLSGCDYVTVSGLKVAKTTQPDPFVITRTNTASPRGRGHRLRRIWFKETGNHSPGNSVGLIMVEHPAKGLSWPGGTPGNRWTTMEGIPEYRVDLLVDQCVFDGTDSTHYWQSNGISYARLMHNIWRNPSLLASGSGVESELVKFGTGWPETFDTHCEWSWNTVEASAVTYAGENTSTYSTGQPWPYGVGIKTNGVTCIGNRIEAARWDIAIRSGINCTIKNNVLWDGKIRVAGANHVIDHNYVRTQHSLDNSGPLVLYGRALDAPPDNIFTDTGPDNPPWIPAADNCKIWRNTLVIDAATDNLDSVMASVQYFQRTANPVTIADPTNIEWRANQFARRIRTGGQGGNVMYSSIGASSTAVITTGGASGVKWDNNRFHAMSGGVDTDLYVPAIIGVRNNAYGASTTDLLEVGLGLPSLDLFITAPDPGGGGIIPPELVGRTSFGVPSWASASDPVDISNLRIEIDLINSTVALPEAPFTVGVSRIGQASIGADTSPLGLVIGDPGPRGTLGTFSVNKGGPDGLPVANWTDITCDVKALRINRGGARRASEAHDVGKLSVTLNNGARQWDPLNLLGPHVISGTTLLRPGLKIRVVADWAGRTFPLGYGIVQDWPVTYQEPGYSTVQLECLGSFSVLAGVDPPELATHYGAGLTYVEHLAKVFELAYASTSMLVVDGAGQATLQSHGFAGNCLSTAHRIMTSEGGELVERADGAILARNRRWWVAVKSAAVLTDDPFSDVSGVPVFGVEPVCSMANTINVVWGARVGGTSIVTTNALSARRGVKSTRRDDLLCQTDAQVQAWADNVLARASMSKVGEQEVVIPTAQLDPIFNSAASWLALVADLGQRYTVRRRPLKGFVYGTEIIERDVWIEGIEHDIDVKSGMWSVTLSLSDGGPASLAATGRFRLSGTGLRGSRLSGVSTHGGTLVGSTS